MTRRLVAIFGMIAIITFPGLAMAKSHGGGGQGGNKGGMHQPSPSESAYEHAGEKASFQRDTHDMGKHEGQMKQEQEQDKDKDKDKEKSKGDDQAAAGEKQKSKEKSKEKGEAAAEMDHGKQEKDQVKSREKAMEQEHQQLKEDKAKSGNLTEQVKPKGGKAK